jgi:hypothetical protein
MMTFETLLAGRTASGGKEDLMGGCGEMVSAKEHN